MRESGWSTLIGSSQQQWALSLTLTLYGTPEWASDVPTGLGRLSRPELPEEIHYEHHLGLVGPRKRDFVRSENSPGES
jgi:hypothetical protein